MEDIEDAVFEEVESAENVQEQFDAAVAMSQSASEAMLESQGWEILSELYKASFSAIAATSLVMIPATQNAEDILTKVADPDAFTKCLNTARNEIAELIRSVGTLHAMHREKTGKPTLEDFEMINDLTLSYSQIQFGVESVIQPLLFAMVDYLKEAGYDTESFLDGVEHE